MPTQQSPPARRNNIHGQIMEFLAKWQTDQRQVRPFFTRLLALLADFDANLEFIVRKGVSASLRARLAGSASRPLFCLIDVVEDSEGRWLSVCFYADTVTDSQDLGNLVPLGLLGEDGYCFDVEQPDETFESYVLERMREARSVSLPGNGR